MPSCLFPEVRYHYCGDIFYTVYMYIREVLPDHSLILFNLHVRIFLPTSGLRFSLPSSVWLYSSIWLSLHMIQLKSSSFLYLISMIFLKFSKLGYLNFAVKLLSWQLLSPLLFFIFTYKSTSREIEKNIYFLLLYHSSMSRIPSQIIAWEFCNLILVWRFNWRSITLAR